MGVLSYEPGAGPPRSVERPYISRCLCIETTSHKGHPSRRCPAARTLNLAPCADSSARSRAVPRPRRSPCCRLEHTGLGAKAGAGLGNRGWQLRGRDVEEVHRRQVRGSQLEVATEQRRGTARRLLSLPEDHLRSLGRAEKRGACLRRIDYLLARFRGRCDLIVRDVVAHHHEDAAVYGRRDSTPAALTLDPVSGVP